MLKQFIKQTPFGVSLLLIFIAIGVVALILPINGAKSLIVRSGSMQPTIGTGDLISVHPQTDYKVGDIVAFHDSSKQSLTITHRIKEVKTQSGQILYQTKGDANKDADFNLVPKKNVIGRADYSIRGIGKFFAFTKTKNGFLTLAIIPAAFVILLESTSIHKEVKKSKKKTARAIYRQTLKTLYSHYGKPMGVPHSSASYKSLYRLFLYKFNGGNHSLHRHINIHPKGISFRAVLPFLASLLLIGNTFSFFSDTETSKGNVFQAAESFCSPTAQGGPFWITGVDAVNQGLRKNNTAVLATRSIQNSILGPNNATTSPDTGFFSLGKGGSITFHFINPVADVAGTDLSIYEVTNGRSTYPLESAKVEVSFDNTTWFNVGSVTSQSNVSGIGTIDVAPYSGIKFVKITDTTDFNLNPDTAADGYDLDAVVAQSVCSTPSPTPTSSPGH